MHIRPYTPADYDAVLALTLATFAPFYEETFPALVGHDEAMIAHQHGQWREDYARELPGTLAPDGAGRCLVADDDGSVAGFVIWRGAQKPDHAYVDSLAVDTGARRAGVASALMERAMADMRADGRAFVELGTGGDEFHAPARRFYESLGFHAVPVTVYMRPL